MDGVCSGAPNSTTTRHHYLAPATASTTILTMSSQVWPRLQYLKRPLTFRSGSDQRVLRRFFGFQLYRVTRDDGSIPSFGSATRLGERLGWVYDREKNSTNRVGFAVQPNLWWKRDGHRGLANVVYLDEDRSHPRDSDGMQKGIFKTTQHMNTSSTEQSWRFLRSSSDVLMSTLWTWSIAKVQGNMCAPLRTYASSQNTPGEQKSTFHVKRQKQEVCSNFYSAELLRHLDVVSAVPNMSTKKSFTFNFLCSRWNLNKTLFVFIPLETWERFTS